jgi:hypothetical protein
MFLIVNLLILLPIFYLSLDETIAMLLLFALLIGFVLKNLITYFWLMEYVYSFYYDFDFSNFVNLFNFYEQNA